MSVNIVKPDGVTLQRIAGLAAYNVDSESDTYLTKNEHQIWIGGDYKTDIDNIWKRLNALSDGTITEQSVLNDYYPIAGETSITGWCEVQDDLNVAKHLYLLSKYDSDNEVMRIPSEIPQLYVTSNGNLKILRNSTAITMQAGSIHMNKNLTFRTTATGYNRTSTSYGPHIVLNARSGIYSIDNYNVSYPMIYQNLNNLWIGAAEAQNYHHCGKTYISTGYNWYDETSAGAWVSNRSIYIAVPRYNEEIALSGEVVPKFAEGPNDAKLYEVLHEGNFIEWLSGLSNSKIAQIKAVLGLS